MLTSVTVSQGRASGATLQRCATSPGATIRAHPGKGLACNAVVVGRTGETRDRFPVLTNLPRRHRVCRRSYSPLDAHSPIYRANARTVFTTPFSGASIKTLRTDQPLFRLQ